MTSDRRLIAIDHIELQAPPGIESELRWFYVDFAGLHPVDNPQSTKPEVMTFRSDRIDLRITILDHPAIESVDGRLTLLMPNLEEAAEMLKDKNYSFHWYRGLSFTDRALILHDPAGNRTTFRRLWSTGRL